MFASNRNEWSSDYTHYSNQQLLEIVRFGVSNNKNLILEAAKRAYNHTLSPNYTSNFIASCTLKYHLVGHGSFFQFRDFNDHTNTLKEFLFEQVKATLTSSLENTTLNIPHLASLKKSLVNKELKQFETEFALVYLNIPPNYKLKYMIAAFIETFYIAPPEYFNTAGFDEQIANKLKIKLKQFLKQLPVRDEEKSEHLYDQHNTQTSLLIQKQYFENGKQALAEGQLNEAFTYFEQLANLQPKLPYIYIYLCVAHLKIFEYFSSKFPDTQSQIVMFSNVIANFNNCLKENYLQYSDNLYSDPHVHIFLKIALAISDVHLTQNALGKIIDQGLALAAANINKNDNLKFIIKYLMPELLRSINENNNKITLDNPIRKMLSEPTLQSHLKQAAPKLYKKLVMDTPSSQSNNHYSFQHSEQKFYLRDHQIERGQTAKNPFIYPST